MEEQLAAYRAKKEKERRAQQALFRRFFSSSKEKAEQSNTECDKNKAPQEEVRQPCQVYEQVPLVQTVKQAEQLYSDWKHYIPLALYVLLWLLLWRFFIEIGFGAVYFIVSGFYLMYRNTRTGPRERNTLSAYSVFNPNQERLDGTFTAEQFEKELRFGAGSVK